MADNERRESVDKISDGNKYVIKKKKNVNKKTVTKTKPPQIKQKKKQQKGIIDYIKSYLCLNILFIK